MSTTLDVMTPSFADVRAQKQQVDRARQGSANGVGWKQQPDAAGWWLWCEGGRGPSDLLLLCADGLEVAGDNEYAEATGLVDENNGSGYNYWASTSTTPRTMPGKWLFLAA